MPHIKLLFKNTEAKRLKKRETLTNKIKSEKISFNIRYNNYGKCKIKDKTVLRPLQNSKNYTNERKKKTNISNIKQELKEKKLMKNSA